nr:unnamed protein product [Callosobruchus chinensis]
MKQGLIMNQVISTYALSNVRNSLCAEHVEEFKVGLRAFEPWALQSKYFYLMSHEVSRKPRRRIF